MFNNLISCKSALKTNFVRAFFQKLSRFFIEIKNLDQKDIPFYLEHRIFIKFNDFFNIRKPSNPYLSGDTFLSIANKIYSKQEGLVIEDGDIIFCSSDNLESLISDVVNSENYKKFILISHHGDRLIDNNFLSFAQNEKLIHWFAQNSVFSHPKVTTIPIGLEDRWRHNNGIISDFDVLAKVNLQKIPKILYGFSVNTNPKVRSKVLGILDRSKLAVRVNCLSRNYRKKLNEFMFVASPEGNGVDCHRTWEAIYLKTIPIVVGDLYKNFPNFPGLVLSSWDDLANLQEDDLVNIYIKQLEIINSTPYIWFEWWSDRIKQAQLIYKTGKL